VEFAWDARYRRQGPWVGLGRIVVARHLGYDVDEAVGVLRAAPER